VSAELEEAFRAALDFRDVSEGFGAVVRACVAALADKIFDDLRGLTERLFGRGWRDGEGVVKDIIATVEDFFSELSVGLVDVYFKKLVGGGGC
jgi:hypothetical protein